MKFVLADLQDTLTQDQIVEMNIALQSEGLIRHGQTLPPDQTDRIQSMLIPGLIRNGFIVFLAIDNEDPIGIAMCQVSFSTYRMSECLVLQDLFVLAEHRKKGIGNELMETVENYASGEKMCRVEFTTTPNNIHAANLYVKRGYTGASVVASGLMESFLRFKGFETSFPPVLLKKDL